MEDEYEILYIAEYNDGIQRTEGEVKAACKKVGAEVIDANHFCNPNVEIPSKYQPCFYQDSEGSFWRGYDCYGYDGRGLDVGVELDGRGGVVAMRKKMPPEASAGQAKPEVKGECQHDWKFELPEGNVEPYEYCTKCPAQRPINSAEPPTRPAEDEPATEEENNTIRAIIYPKRSQVMFKSGAEEQRWKEANALLHIRRFVQREVEEKGIETAARYIKSNVVPTTLREAIKEMLSTLTPNIMHLCAQEAYWRSMGEIEEMEKRFETEKQQAVEKAVRAALAIPSGKLCNSDLAQACEQIAESEKHGVGAKFREGEFCAYDYLIDKAKKLRVRD